MSAILGIGASFIPDPVWLRISVVALALIAVWIMARAAERSDRQADRHRELDHSENMFAHDTTQDLINELNRRLLREERQIVQHGSLVERLRLASAQLLVFLSSEQDAGQAKRTFDSAFRGRIEELLHEASIRAGVRGLTDDALHQLAAVSNAADMRHIAGNLNEIAYVVETGKPLR